jgi:hypothetical protein
MLERSRSLEQRESPVTFYAKSASSPGADPSASVQRISTQPQGTFTPIYQPNQIDEVIKDIPKKQDPIPDQI